MATSTRRQSTMMNKEKDCLSKPFEDSDHSNITATTVETVDEMLSITFPLPSSSDLMGSFALPESEFLMEAAPIAAESLPEPDDVIHYLVMVELLKDCPNAVVTALEQLVELTYSGPNKPMNEHKQEALQLGAPSFVISAMLKWNSNSTVQSEGCFCLSMLSGKSQDAKCEIVQAGGVDVIVNAMRTFPDSIKIHFRACSLLWTLFASPSAESAPWLTGATERFVEDLNGLKLIKRAMKKFPQDGAWQAICCIVLFNISTYCEKAYIREESLVLAVAGALDSFKEHEDVQKYGQKFMRQVFAEPSVPAEEAKQPPALEKAPKEEPAKEERSFIHGLHTCDSCLTFPIVGMRFHALNVPGYKSYDLCGKCHASYGGGEIQFEAVELRRDRRLQKRWHRRSERMDNSNRGSARGFGRRWSSLRSLDV